MYCSSAPVVCVSASVLSLDLYCMCASAAVVCASAPVLCLDLYRASLRLYCVSVHVLYVQI